MSSRIATICSIFAPEELKNSGHGEGDNLFELN